MTALARLEVGNPIKGWTLGKTPDGAVLTHQAVLAAAATFPLSLDEDGEFIFERKLFLNKVLEIADSEGEG